MGIPSADIKDTNIGKEHHEHENGDVHDNSFVNRPSLNPILEKALVVDKTGQIDAVIYPSSVNKVGQSDVSEQETSTTHESSRGLNKEDKTATTSKSAGVKRERQPFKYEIPHLDDAFIVCHNESDPEPEGKIYLDGEHGDGNWHYYDDKDLTDIVGYDVDDYVDDDDDDDNGNDDWMDEVDEDDLEVDEEGIPIYPHSRKEYRQMISHRLRKRRHY